VNYQIELFNSQVAGHKGFFGYHFVVLLIGVFPASVYALKSFRRSSAENEQGALFFRWMMILFWVVLIVFSIVKTKIVHYSSLAYFPLTFLTAYAILKTDKGEWKRSSVISGILLFIAVLFAGLIYAFQYIARHKEKIIESGIIKDPFAAANLSAETSFTGFEFLTGIFLLVGILISLIVFKSTYIKSVISVFTVSIIFTVLSVIVLVPQAEKISQKAAIDFYEEKADEEAYFLTYHMKSYAHLFYGKASTFGKDKIPDPGELLKGEVDKTVYVVCKIHAKDSFMKNYPDFRLLYEKNGFVFWQRMK
jgi:hypothetical protein